MKKEQINIRDPFVLFEDGVYYLYGTRAANFGKGAGGFDVYTSTDLENWSAPHTCLDSVALDLNRDVNWAPEVHKYNGSYYMFATFNQENGRRGTYSLKSASPLGPFLPHSDGALTPIDWECLDGTLYCDAGGTPYLVFCHEHRQVIDGTICYVPLTADLSAPAGEAVTLFAATSLPWSDPYEPEKHFVTDGPFFYTTQTGTLLMLWSTHIGGQYAQCLARSESGKVWGPYTHLPPLFREDGGHGMIFCAGDKLLLTLHQPNITGYERPVFLELKDEGDTLSL